MARKLPALTKENGAFWQGGEHGKLMITRCNACGYWLHPPAQLCVKCDSRDIAPQPVSGRGKVASFTINYQKWSPDLETPYVVAIVELTEQDELQFVTNIVNCPPEEVTIGMEVEVTFEQIEDIWLPFFERSAA